MLLVGVVKIWSIFLEQHGGRSIDNHRGKKNLVLSAWGDESLLHQDYINPYYVADVYEAYSKKTCQNLVSIVFIYFFFMRNLPNLFCEL